MGLDQSYLKFMLPVVLSFAAFVVYALINGTIDVPQLELGLVGLAAATSAFWVGNGSVGLSRYLKALTPAALTVIAVLVHYAITGEWDRAEWILGATGLVSAFITLVVPNTAP